MTEVTPIKVRTASGTSLELVWEPSAGAFRDLPTRTLYSLHVSRISPTQPADPADDNVYVRPHSTR